MNLLPRKTPHHLHHKPPFIRRHYKWVLWISLSLYLYLFLPSLSPKTTLPTTTLPTTTTPRAVIESHPFPHTHPTSPNPNFPSIFIYDLPPRFNLDWLANPRCSSHLFAAEVALHAALLSSTARTLSPSAADLFFLPVYVSCNFSTPNGFPSLSHARPLLADAVSHVSTLHPFWNRTGGRDHVIIATHDYGACFHAMEDVAVAAGIPAFLKNSIILQTFGVRGTHACQEAEHVLIPPYVSPPQAAPPPEAGPRDIFVFFRGKMEVHPKNVSGRFYSRRVRTDILRRFGGNPRFYLKRHRFDGYRSEIARSVFCLCPLGWAPWSPRLVEAVALGCVPVIIADGIRLPFPDAVPWPEISVTVAERDVGRLEAVLDHVAATNLTVIQRRLWDPAVRRSLLFHRTMVEGDASWQVLRALGRKVDRRMGGRRVAEEIS